MKPIEKTANDLFQTLRTRFSPLNIGDENAEVTVDPAAARFFSFMYKEGEEELGPVSISIVNNRGLKVYYSNDMVENMQNTSDWYALLKQLRYFAKQNLLSFDARNIQKNQLDTRDFNFLKVNDGPYQEKDVEITESTMFGTKRKSMQRFENATLIVNHKKSVDEAVRGSRSRYIESIFIENNGERFRFPVNYLNGARAMAVHVSEGGTPYDAVGQHIITTVTEMQNLAKFARMTKHHAMEDADAADIRNRVVEAYNSIKKDIMRMQNVNNYRSFAETFTPAEASGEADVTTLQEKFTRKVWNEKMNELLPSVQRALESSPANEAYKPGVTVLTRTITLEPEEIATIKNDIARAGIEMRANGDQVTFKTAKIKTLAKILNKHVDFGATDVGSVLDIPAEIGPLYDDEQVNETEDSTYMKQWYDYSEDFAMLELYVDDELVDQWNGYFGANATGNPLAEKFVAMAKQNGVDPIGLKVIDGEDGEEGVFTSSGLKWNSNEEVELDEASPSVEKSIKNPNFMLVLKKDDAADSMIRRTKFTRADGLLAFIMSDIASRIIGNEADAVANFASEMSINIGDEGASFGTKITPEYKRDKQLAMLLAKKYLDDLKMISTDAEYAGKVRKDPKDVYGAKKVRGGGYHEAVDAFESWANNVAESFGNFNKQPVTEGVWAVPNTVEKVKLLRKTLNSPIPAGQAAKILVGLIGDDNLFDLIGEIEDEDPNQDVRATIYGWLRNDFTKMNLVNPLTQDVKKALTQYFGIPSRKFVTNEATTTGTTGITGTAAVGMPKVGTTNPTVVKALSGGDANKARDIKRISDKLAKGQRLSPQEQPIAGEIAKSVMTTKKSTAAMQALAQDKHTEMNENPVKDAVIHRLSMRHNLTDLLKTHGLDRVEAAINDVAGFYNDAEELGSSDISIMAKQVLDNLTASTDESIVTEKTLKVKAERDFDGDGEIESSEEEYMGSRDRAIKKASKPMEDQDNDLVGESLALLKLYAGL
jgi:hypothetical protein